jgi:hypothetical protein
VRDNLRVVRDVHGYDIDGVQNGRASFDFFRFLRVDRQNLCWACVSEGFRISDTSRVECALGWVSREGERSYHSASGLEREQEVGFDS